MNVSDASWSKPDLFEGMRFDIYQDAKPQICSQPRLILFVPRFFFLILPSYFFFNLLFLWFVNVFFRSFFPCVHGFIATYFSILRHQQSATAHYEFGANFFYPKVCCPYCHKVILLDKPSFLSRARCLFGRLMCCWYLLEGYWLMDGLMPEGNVTLTENLSLKFNAQVCFMFFVNSIFHRFVLLGFEFIVVFLCCLFAAPEWGPFPSGRI